MIPLPYPIGFTVYTIANCSFCEKVKSILQTQHRPYHLISCDEMNRADFLTTMDSYSTVQHRTFPFVYLDGTFMGGYQETKTYLDHHIVFDDEF